MRVLVVMSWYTLPATLWLTSLLLIHVGALHLEYYAMFFKLDFNLFIVSISWQGWDDPYVTLTHNGLLKWKYPEMNSVDFLFEVFLL